MRMLAQLSATAMLLMTAALPAHALSIKNAGEKEITVGVDTGPAEKVYTIAPGSVAEVAEDCSKGCALTGPWGYSRTATAGEQIETNGASLVTSTAPAKPAKVAAAAPAKKKHLASKSKKKTYAARKAKPAEAKKKSPYFRGSFASLFAGKVE